MDATSYVDESLRSFLLKLSGRSPEPAGGAALALAGASAAALMSLACEAGRVAAGTPEGQTDFASCQARSVGLMHHVQDLLDEDVVAYREVLAALRLPQSTPAQQSSRRDALDKALQRAVEIPLLIAEAGLEVLDLGVRMAPSIKPPIVGDLAAALHLSEAAVKGSLRNARLNLAAMMTGPVESALRQRLEDLADRLGEGCLRAEGVLRLIAAD